MKGWSIMILLFIILGCTSPQEPSPEEDTTPLSSEKLTAEQYSFPPVRPTTESKVTPTTPKTTPRSKQLHELLTKADKIVKSYEFTYAPPPDNLARDRYSIKGNKMRVRKIYRPTVVKPTEYFDTIYLDTEQRTALAFCEERGTPCLKGKQNHPVNYEEYVVKTPMDWVQEIENGEVKGPHYLFERQTYQVTYEKEGKQYFFWIDAHYGLVVRVVIDDSKEKVRYDYFDLVVNQLKDSDVLPNKA